MASPIGLHTPQLLAVGAPVAAAAAPPTWILIALCVMIVACMIIHAKMHPRPVRPMNF